MTISYIPQDDPLGLAHCVLIAENFLEDDDFIMYLGDNMLEQGLTEMVDRFSSERANDQLDCRILLKKVEKQKTDPKKIPIKTWSRKSTIIPEFVGVSFLIYNGKKFIPLTISEDMVGHKIGEFAPTRTFAGHTPADKKAAKEAGSETKVEKK